MKMKSTLITLVFAIIGFAASAQLNLQWAKSLEGTNSETVNSIAVDAAGNVYTTGFIYGTVDFDPGPGTANLTATASSKVFILKTDASGNFLWAKLLDGVETVC